MNTPGPIIFGFAFQRNISSPVLMGLDHISHKTYLNSLETIEDFILFLAKEQPSYILGLGYYSGRDRDKIRIETRCTNKIKNDYFEDSHIRSQTIFPFLPENDYCKIGKTMGNSYCNYTSYRIAKLINTDLLKSKYTFLHLPKDMSKEKLVDKINVLIEKHILA